MRNEMLGISSSLASADLAHS